MTKRCIYCNQEISDNYITDFCEKCGIGTFGVKMFNAIKANMEHARARGDLDQNGIY